MSFCFSMIVFADAKQLIVIRTSELVYAFMSNLTAA
jgi:hypothetical protein